MQLINSDEDSQKKIAKRFQSLFSSYEKFACLSAWASSGGKNNDFYFYKMLRHQKTKIDKMVIGTHMYQTEPDFIEEFIDQPTVRFHKPKGGLFHPKLYLFFTPSSNQPTKWCLLIGSANLTHAAFYRNKEVLLETNHSEGGESFFREIYDTIEQYWKETEGFTRAYFENYKALYPLQQRKVRSLTDEYEKNQENSNLQTSNDVSETRIFMMTWDEFVEEIQREDWKEEELPWNKRLRVLKKARRLFESVESFSQLSTDDRKFIAGLPCSDEDWAVFGSMKGAGKFHGEINNNNSEIAKAINAIPLQGEIRQEHFDAFVHHFPHDDWIGTATRLLAMKRPDTFICLDSKNERRLCHDFGIKPVESYSEYWNSIVARITDSNWWNASEPSNETEKEIYKGRAAFLDALYYEA